MIRTILSIITSKPLKISISTFKPIVFRSKFSFSAPNHPTVQKILRSNDVKSLEEMFQQIGGLPQKNRQLALKLILNKVFSAKVPFSILQNPKFSKILQKNSQLMLEANLFCVKELMKTLNQPQSKKLQAFDSINNYFLKCFDSIKKINKSTLAKYQVMLHKRFADYNLLYLSKSSNAQNKKFVLQKSKEFYISSLLKMGTVIEQQREKFNKLTNSPQEIKKQSKKESSQEEQLRKNALQENIRMLIETNSQNIIHLFMAEKQLASISKSSESMEMDKMISLLPYLESSLGYYRIFSKMTQFSIFYHRVKKIFHQINYYSKIIAFNKFNTDHKQRKVNDEKQWIELINNLQKLYQQTVQDIKQISKQPKHISHLQEMTVLLLNIRIHKFMRKQLDLQQLKQILFYQVSLILQLITIPEDKKIVSSNLAKLVKQMLDDKLNKKSRSK